MAEGDDGGLRRRGRILSVGAGVLLVGAASYGFAAHRGANARLEELEAQITVEFEGTTRADLELSAFSTADGDEVQTQQLTLGTGQQPSEAEWNEVQAAARYDTSYWTEHRCVVVTWTEGDVSFRSLDGSDCALSGR